MAVVCLGGLHKPKSYLIAHLQLAASNKGWELENLIMKTLITDVSDPETISEVPDQVGP